MKWNTHTIIQLDEAPAAQWSAVGCHGHRTGSAAAAGGSSCRHSALRSHKMATYTRSCSGTGGAADTSSVDGGCGVAINNEQFNQSVQTMALGSQHRDHVCTISLGMPLQHCNCARGMQGLTPLCGCFVALVYTSITHSSHISAMLVGVQTHAVRPLARAGVLCCCIRPRGRGHARRPAPTP
jgi:hypothetical protein